MSLPFAGRLVSGAVFVVFGAGKFVNHGAEVDSFSTYGLPSPDAFVYAIGTLEIVGGALLIIGLATRAAALVMAGNMVGAIAVSGIGQGEVVSLTLAPFQLCVMLYLLAAGPGRPSLDLRRSREPERPSSGERQTRAQPR